VLEIPNFHTDPDFSVLVLGDADGEKQTFFEAARHPPSDLGMTSYWCVRVMRARDGNVSLSGYGE